VSEIIVEADDVLNLEQLSTYEDALCRRRGAAM
jgi:hypothetical protein